MVSTITLSPLFSLPFGQGLEMCGPHRRSSAGTLRRIPQAVSAVATFENGIAKQTTKFEFQYRKR